MDELQPWLKRLLDWELLHSTGRTQATRYFVAPDVLRSLDFSSTTTLKRIETHRLAALVLEDVGRYPRSKIGEIHGRIGQEIPRSQLRRAIEGLVKDGKLRMEGVRNGARYAVPA